MRATILLLLLTGCGAFVPVDEDAVDAEPVRQLTTVVSSPAETDQPEPVRYEWRTVTVQRSGPGWSQQQMQAVLVPVNARDAR